MYYLGLDGGGTKTKAVLTDENLNILAEATAGPSTFLINGTDVVSETIYNLLADCTRQAGITLGDLNGVVIGTTGAGRRNDAEKLETAFKEYAKTKGTPIENFYVDSDAGIALEGAFSGKPGSILIAGTGSIMFGKDADGEIHRVGGYGRYLGDEGSGYSIGKHGLQAVAIAYDGRGASTLLVDLVKEKFGISNGPELITEVYKNNFDVAKVAPLVVEAAEKEDSACSAIIEQEVNHLMLHLRAMKMKLNVIQMKLTLIGGTITTDNYYAKKFRTNVTKYLPEVEIKDADYAPDLGAVLMAKSRFNA